MNTFLELIHSRHSFRGEYQAVPVKREDLIKIMQAGIDAPSGCNKQTTSFIAIDDPHILKQLLNVIDPPIGQSAPAAICVLTQRIYAYRDKCFAIQDYSAAIENMLLALIALGYESCWYEGHITDEDQIGKKMAHILNVPDDYELVCFLPIGIPKEKKVIKIKKKYTDSCRLFVLKSNRKENQKKMFEVGEYIVYGCKGVCQVEEITHIDIPGSNKDRLYYVLAPLEDRNGKIYAPTDNAKVAMRKVITRQEAEQLIEEMPQIEELWVANEKQREMQYKEALKTCDFRAWISIIKTLYFRKKERIAQGKKITSLDERYLKAAENELYGELSLILGLPKSQMEDFICRKLEA